MPAGDQGSVQHLTLDYVPVDVFINLLSFFSDVKELKCHSIYPPREVQCVHMYSVAWDALVVVPITISLCFDYGHHSI